MPAFTSSEAKDVIRDRIDYEIIAEFKRDFYPDQSLAYLGLPGEQLLDVLSWRPFIGRLTAIQIAETPADAAIADNIVRNSMFHRLERGFELIRSDIDFLLGTDEGRQRLAWPYQIINLDYSGGLVNLTDARTSRRLDALRGIFDRQAGVCFLLLLTLNMRDRDRGELSQLIDAEEEEMASLDLEGVGECFTAHRSLGHAGDLKIYVPIFLASVANRHSLAFHPPILYKGTRTMIHFVIRCSPFVDAAAGRIFRTRDRLPLVNLPLMVLHGRDDLRRADLPVIRPSTET